MKRPRKQRRRWIWISVINVAAQPHDGDTYRALFFKAAKEDPVKAHGDRYAAIGSATDNGDGVLIGEIVAFTEIDIARPWLNLLRGETASPEEVRERVSLPAELKPHLVRIPYVFFVADHRFVFEAGKMTAASASLVLERLFNKPKVLKAAATKAVTVTVEQARAPLERIFKLARLDRLKIHLVKPNADDTSELEEDFKKRLEEQAASAWTTEWEAEQEKSLKPDKETKAYCELALSYGYVEAKGRNEHNRVVEEKTEDHPLLDRYEYDPNEETMYGFLKRIGERVVKVIKQGRRKK
jgi:hypothetical protein